MNWLGKKKPPPIRSLISEGTVVKGDISFAEGLRIDGEVHGSVSAAGDGDNMLVISEKARVHGKVVAGHVIINGEVRGRCSLTTGWNCSPRRGSLATSATNCLKCTRVRRSMVS
jgi:cytoskeletal protein CcmA (bactofilin family)